jgi:hypothetical protein
MITGSLLAGAGSGGMCGVVLGIVLSIALVQFEIWRSGDPSGAGAALPPLIVAAGAFGMIGAVTGVLVVFKRNRGSF